MVLIPRVKADSSVQRAVDALGERLNTVSQFPPKDAVVSELTLGTDPVTFYHGLGRKPVGFLIIDRDADARVWRSSNLSNTSLTLQASAAVNVKVWIF